MRWRSKSALPFLTLYKESKRIRDVLRRRQEIESSDAEATDWPPSFSDFFAGRCVNLQLDAATDSRLTSDGNWDPQWQDTLGILGLNARASNAGFQLAGQNYQS